MKRIIKGIFNPVVKALVTNNFSWRGVSLFIRLANWLQFERHKYDNKMVGQFLQVYFNERVVKKGFFKGLKYPSFSSNGSSIFPKLSGSYEYELYPALVSLENKKYAEIIDIGCAEGYYAVGLSLRFPGAKIYAYDTDVTALEACKAMAVENEVSERVLLDTTCTAKELENFRFTGKGLIVCDCEGYERELFCASNIPNLHTCDLIIEMHPMYVPDITEYLTNLFKHTHEISIVTSYDDERKMFDFKKDHPRLSKPELLQLVQEGRSYSMDWMILKAKG